LMLELIQLDLQAGHGVVVHQCQGAGHDFIGVVLAIRRNFLLNHFRQEGGAVIETAVDHELIQVFQYLGG
jgi:hypothetical protein